MRRVRRWHSKHAVSLTFSFGFFSAVNARYSHSPLRSVLDFSHKQLITTRPCSVKRQCRAARSGVEGKIMGVSFAAKLRRGSTRTCSAAWSRCARWQCVCVPSPSTGSGHRKCGNAIGRGRRCTDATRSFSGRLSDRAFSNPLKRTGAALARMVPRSELTRRAKVGLMRHNKRGRRVAGIYSITSSARELGREDQDRAKRSPDPYAGAPAAPGHGAAARQLAGQPS